MSASQHMVRVIRNTSPPPSKRQPALSPQTRMVLLIGLTCGVLYLVAVAAGPELPYMISSLQGRLALSHYVGH